MEELTSLDAYLLAITHWRKALNGGLRLLGVLRSFLMAFCCFLLWAWIQPEAWAQQVSIFLISLFAFLCLSWSRGLRGPKVDEWLLALEMAHPEAPRSAFQLGETDEIEPTWESYIKEDFAIQKKEGKHLFISKLGSLLLRSLKTIQNQAEYFQYLELAQYHVAVVRYQFLLHLD